MLLPHTGNVSVYVYSTGDIVSDSLQRLRNWETPEMNEWLWAIRQWRRPAAAAAAGQLPSSNGSSINSSSSSGAVPDRPLTVDIGANLGWFTLNAAAAGARVAAFEGGGQGGLAGRH